MRTLRVAGVALFLALALSTSVYAQSNWDRVSLNASVGPSFANVGTTFSTLAGLDVELNDRAALVGEFGILPHAPFQDASEIAAPAIDSGFRSPRVSAYHWNANVRVRPFEVGSFEPYITGGVGSFTADTIVENRTLDSDSIALVEDRRRVTNLSTNVGAGVLYRVNDWVGLTADYRTFFVHRTGETPRVNRFTAGLTLSFNNK